MTTMLSSDLPLPKIGRGKVHDIYAVDNPLPHQMDVHNRQGSRQNGWRLSRHFQRVIITVTRY